MNQWMGRTARIEIYTYHLEPNWLVVSIISCSFAEKRNIQRVFLFTQITWFLVQCGVGVPAVSSASSWAVLDSSEGPVARWPGWTQHAVFCFNQQALGTYHASSKHWLVGWNIFIFYPNGMRISIDVRILFQEGWHTTRESVFFWMRHFVLSFYAYVAPQTWNYGTWLISFDWNYQGLLKAISKKAPSIRQREPSPCSRQYAPRRRQTVVAVRLTPPENLIEVQSWVNNIIISKY